jgi:trigger factor
MPTVTRENIGLLNDRIVVTVNKEDYFPPFEKALKHYAKSANIPGFRKGMVPAGVIRKMHGPSVFVDEVLRSIERNLMDYLRQEKLEIFGQPLPSTENAADKINMENAGDYSFSFEVGLKPAFEVSDLKKAKVTLYQVNVSDEMVNEELERLRNRLGKMQEPEAVTSEDNVLNAGFQACNPDGEVIEGSAAKENSLLVKYFSSDFQPKLMGSKKDDSFVLQLKDAFGEKEQEWLISDLGLSKDDPNALQQHFKMTIAKVGLVEKRELNAEFFKEAYPNKEINDEAGLREVLRNEIAEYWGKQTRNHLQHELYHVLNEKTEMEFPEPFLRRWLMTGGEEPKNEEEVDKEFPTFKNQLRWTLVSDKIVNEQQLQVTPDEMRNYMKQQVMGYFGGMSMEGNMEWLDTYVDRMMKDEQQLESNYRRLLTEKVFEWAETQVDPEKKSISVEEFLKLQEAHSHEH